MHDRSNKIKLSQEPSFHDKTHDFLNNKDNNQNNNLLHILDLDKVNETSENNEIESKEKSENFEKNSKGRRSSQLADTILHNRSSFLKSRSEEEGNVRKRKSVSAAEFKQFKIVKPSKTSKKFSAKRYIEEREKNMREGSNLEEKKSKKEDIWRIKGTPLSKYSSVQNPENFTQKGEEFNIKKAIRLNNEREKMMDISIDIENYNPRDDSIAINSQKRFSRDEFQEEEEDFKQFVEELSRSGKQSLSPEKSEYLKKRTGGTSKDSLMVSITKKDKKSVFVPEEEEDINNSSFNHESDKKSSKEEDKDENKSLREENDKKNNIEFITYDLPPRSGKRHSIIDKSIEKRLSGSFHTKRKKSLFSNENKNENSEIKNVSFSNSASLFSRRREIRSRTVSNSMNSGEKMSSRSNGRNSSHSFTRTFIADVSVDAEGNDVVNQFKLMNSIGKGSFGSVRKARNLKDKKFYVIFANFIMKFFFKEKRINFFFY